MTLNEANDRWYRSEPMEGINFFYNDYVKIIVGPFADRYASVISMTSLEPVSYLIELDGEAGGDITVLQKDLEKIEDGAHGS